MNQVQVTIFFYESYVKLFNLCKFSIAVNNLKLKFKKSANLIDNEFAYINRYENSSVLLKDFDKLREKHGNCFYRNSFSAIDICEGSLVRIIFIFLKLHKHHLHHHH